MNSIFKLFSILFYVFLAAFLLGGLALVGIQAVGLVTGSGDTITGAKAALAPWVFGAATLCAVSAFVLGYRPEALRAQREQRKRDKEVQFHEHRDHDRDRDENSAE